MISQIKFAKSERTRELTGFVQLKYTFLNFGIYEIVVTFE